MSKASDTSHQIELDTRHMLRALRLAEKGLYSAAPNPRVGCVIVQGEQVVGEGYHLQTGAAHAEVAALKAAGRDAAGACVYVTLEPCCHHGRTPPCVDALKAAGVGRVVFAVGDPNPRVDGGGRGRLVAAGIAVSSGVLKEPALELNRGFHLRMERGRPFVTVKLGMSLDGKLALANGRSQWITAAASRADVQRLRARSCAIMTGIDTVLHDDPSLNVRDERFEMLGRQPLRVVADSRLRLEPGARMLALAGRTVVFTGVSESDRHKPLIAAGASIETVPLRAGRLDLSAVLQQLGEMEINELLVEAGPTLSGAILEAGLVDELVIYLAPMVLGADAADAFVLPPLTDLIDAPRFRFVDTTEIGGDIRITARPDPA